MDSLRLLLELTDEHVADLHGVSLVQLNVTRVMTLVSNTCRNQGRRGKLPTLSEHFRSHDGDVFMQFKTDRSLPLHE